MFGELSLFSPYFYPLECSSIEEWALIDVVHNNARNSDERRRAKEEIKIRNMEQQLKVAERRVQEAERRAEDALLQKQNAEIRLSEVRLCYENTLRQLSETESRLTEALQAFQETRQRDLHDKGSQANLPFVGPDL